MLTSSFSILKSLINFAKLIPGFFALVFGVIAIFFLFSRIIALLNMMLEKTDSLFFHYLLAIAMMACSAFLTFYFAIGCSRFLQRIFPLHASGQIRYLVIAVGATIGIVWTSKIIISFIDNLDSIDSILPNSFLILFLLPSLSVLFLAFRHLLDRNRLRKPFVLFLRKFGTNADYTLISSLLRATPIGMPVVSLVGENDKLKTWDPLLLGFSGLNLLHPFDSSPIFIKARNEEWQKYIEPLITNSSLIVIDTSESTPSLKEEVRMIQATGKIDNTIWVQQKPYSEVGNESEFTIDEPLLNSLVKKDHRVLYDPSWGMDMLRVLLIVPVVWYGYFLIKSFGSALSGEDFEFFYWGDRAVFGDGSVGRAMGRLFVWGLLVTPFFHSIPSTRTRRTLFKLTKQIFQKHQTSI